jgi:hypothetical protein
MAFRRIVKRLRNNFALMEIGSAGISTAFIIHEYADLLKNTGLWSHRSSGNPEGK